MGNRAIVAYEEPKSLYDDDEQRYTIHYSHWGANGNRLVDDITAETPFGSDEIPEKEMFAGLLGAFNKAAGEEAFGSDVGVYVGMVVEDTDVETDPVATGVTEKEIIDNHVSYMHHDALYFVDDTWNVNRYNPISCRFPAARTRGEDVEEYGALVQKKHYDVQCNDLQNIVSGMESILEEQVFSGMITWDEARDMLSEKLIKHVMMRPHARIHPGSAIWTSEMETRYPSGHVFFNSLTHLGHRKVPDTSKKSWKATDDPPWVDSFNAVSKQCGRDIEPDD